MHPADAGRGQQRRDAQPDPAGAVHHHGGGAPAAEQLQRGPGRPEQGQRGQVGAESAGRAGRAEGAGGRRRARRRRRLRRPGHGPAARLGQHAGVAQVRQQAAEHARVHPGPAGRGEHLGLGPAAVQAEQHPRGRLVDPVDHDGAVRIEPQLELAVGPPHRTQGGGQQRPQRPARRGAGPHRGEADGCGWSRHGTHGRPPGDLG